MLTLEDRPTAAAVRVKDAELVDVVEVAEWMLGELQAVMAPCFARAETRLAARQYVRGLASLVERKNSWQLAEHAGYASPDRFQRLLGDSAWDEHALCQDVRDFAVTYLGDDEAVLVVDDTGFLKKGS